MFSEIMSRSRFQAFGNLIGFAIWLQIANQAISPSLPEEESNRLDEYLWK
jgi:hypothetical protein